MCGPREFGLPTNEGIRLCELFYPYEHMLSTYYDEVNVLLDDEERRRRRRRRRLLGVWPSIQKGFTNILTADRNQIDLTNLTAVIMFFMLEQPEYVFVAAAKVGGILANDTYPYEFLIDNMLIQNNLIRSAHRNDVKKFVLPIDSNINLVTINTTNIVASIPALSVIAKPRIGPLPCQNKIIAVSNVVTLASIIVLNALS